jgi:hypothetical protein
VVADGKQEAIMFDFDQARVWLQQKFSTQNSGDLQFRLICSGGPKPACTVEASGGNVAGTFSIWNTGEADIDVLREGKFVLQNWGMKLSNETLPVVADNFLRALLE